MKTDNQIIQDASIQIASTLAQTAFKNGSYGHSMQTLTETECKSIAKSSVELARQLAIELRLQGIKA